MAKKIAFTTKGDNWDAMMDPRFGRTEYFLVYEESTEEVSVYDNRDIQGEAHGAGPKTASRLFEMGAAVLITGNGPGGNAGTVLEKAGVEVYIGAGNMSVKDAYEAYKNGKLEKI